MTCRVMDQRKRLALPAALLLIGSSMMMPGSALLAADAVPPIPYQPLDGFDAAPLASEASGVAQELGSGVASYYGRQFAGRRTASGETFNPAHLTAAHRTLPFGSLVRVTETGSGRSVIVRINDRGPFGRGRLIDLSEAAARQLGLIGPGHGAVRLALLDRNALQPEAVETPAP